MVFYKYFWPLINPSPPYKMTTVRNIFTSYREFLAVPLVNEVEWTSNKYLYINIIHAAS